MRRLLSLLLATCVLCLTGFVVGPGIAYAEACASGPIGTDPKTVGVLGEEVHVPGVLVQVCASPHGSVFEPTQWADLRIEGGSCDPSIFDPACFTAYLDSDQIPHWTNWTVYTWVDGVPQDPISIDLPPIPQGASICVVSVGFRTAPTHDCLAFVDLGQ